VIVVKVVHNINSTVIPTTRRLSSLSTLAGDEFLDRANMDMEIECEAVGDSSAGGTECVADSDESYAL